MLAILSEISPQFFLAIIAILFAVAAWISSQGNVNKATAKKEETESQIIAAQSAAAIQLQQQISDMVVKFMGQVSDVRKQYDELSGSNTTLREEFARVNTRLEMREAEVKKLEERVQGAEHARAKSEENTIALLSKVSMVDQLRGKVEQLSSDVGTLSNKLDESRRREIELNQKNTELEKRNTQADQEKQKLREQIAELESKVIELQNRIAELEAQVKPNGSTEEIEKVEG